MFLGDAYKTMAARLEEKYTHIYQHVARHAATQVLSKEWETFMEDLKWVERRSKIARRVRKDCTGGRSRFRVKRRIN